MSKFKTSPLICRLCGLLVLVGMPQNVHADAVGAELLLLTAHVSRDTILLGEQYKRKLSSDGQFVITPGMEIYYDRTLRQAWLGLDDLRFAAGAYYDSVDHKSGYVGMLYRWDLPGPGQTRVSFGLGPTLIFRESWNRIPEYVDDGYYHERDDFLPGYQHKWIIGGDIDFQWQLEDDLQGVLSVVPGIPFVITGSFGLRWLLK